MTFYVNFPPEVIAATAEAAAAAAEEGITVEPDVDLAEKVSRFMIYWLRKNSFFNNISRSEILQLVIVLPFLVLDKLKL